MKYKYFIIGAVILIALASFYFLYFKQPEISITSINKQSKTAVIKIGNKTIRYTNSDGQGLIMPINWLGFDVLIEGDFNSATLTLRKHGEPVQTRIIDFS